MQSPPDNVFEPRTFRLGRGARLELGPKSQVMGILNVTPDSFSDGGLAADADAAITAALAMAEAGAAIIDIGGESTRPGADPVDAIEEQRRIMPVIEALGGRGLLISVDTWRAETARLALGAGAHLVNDVWGLQREPEIARVASDAGAAVAIMHTGRDRTCLPDLIEDQFFWFKASLAIARKAGIGDDRILIDPGFGFAKDARDNLELMARFAELHALSLPLLAGTSRKRFIGGLTGREAPDRDVGTVATSVALRLAGAAMFRVHNVAFNMDGLAVADAMVQSSREQDRGHG
ncbi:MAG: dihydropteroate synthase [Hoeflea sp.]|uniref:dihydropteroate synthase n=1 Tax=Hoeflea sp. TaxID=1940281 RepID=UPI001DED1F7D|nr:dihydropteroate synthase [Hoeflea sp.]MBU4530444.1 dihydropteroate synthase [Alphaproteobacteria bacterium]MBU4545231.1 dihydropteroate synthase [Alphaproteobacteria bacterium]MBU4549569.1 dihydropteroate synthase [Alphaproteobacteria bacterium]MBV1722034.1 dihydropteroate synthase [Hoeflea sp.]MBV1761384.1 dihydropteroate synthase [Hoeflea sp.]